VSGGSGETAVRNDSTRKLALSPQAPQGLKEGRLRGDMINLIIQYYTPEESIPLIDCQMKILPRKDNKVQQPLREIKDELQKILQKKQRRAK
ncbi:hypothetical protein KUCAC02_037607, partial [Chaenocephalus aceratus]